MLSRGLNIALLPLGLVFLVIAGVRISGVLG
jgi:hypothetical protein